MSNPTVLAVLVSAALGLGVLTVVRRATFQSRVTPPTAANGFPLIGHLFALAKRPSEWERILFEGMDPSVNIVRVFLPGRVLYFTRGTEVARKMFTDSTLNKRPATDDALKQLEIHETGITFNSRIDSWKRNRSTVLLPMHPPKNFQAFKLNLLGLAQNTELLIEGIARPRFIRSLAPRVTVQFTELASVLDQVAASAQPVLVNKMLNLLSMDIIFDVVFSVQNRESQSYLSSLLDPDLPVSEHRFLDMMKGLMDGMTFFLRMPKWGYTWVPSIRSSAKKHRANVNIFIDALQQHIDDKKLEIEGVDFSSTSNQLIDFSTSLLIHPETSKPENLRELQSILRAAIAGGTETSANTMSFMLYELCKNPNVADSIHDEVVRVVQDVTGDGQGDVTSEIVGKLAYLEAAINETHRMYSIASMIGRELEQDHVFDGYTLEAGSSLTVLTQANHMSEKLWDNPQKFDPTRFLDAEKKTEGGPLGLGFAFTPFGYGVRNPGEALAMMEMKVLVANVCRRYKIRLVDPTATVKTRLGLTLQCLDLPIVFEMRV
ncbi:hypothetical protein CcCBS67573_g04156 [Chytriomyces confervae]|uniref:Cytochrome P450 n=1 Tax=Chytriomyces confervae TaxID=246404 RepID=A0A507FH07_9FUNG|nr:hypothetical protein CcCBS67573_g04156 [Chytriomyces confervae]